MLYRWKKEHDERQSGGEASAAAEASGAQGYTFNASGLNAKTVSKYGGTVQDPSASNIKAYHVDGEILNTIQENVPMAPKAVGTQITLPASSLSPVGRHSINDINAGLELSKVDSEIKLNRIITSPS